MDEVKNKKYLLASKSLKWFQLFILFFLILSFQFSSITFGYESFIMISIGIFGVINFLFMMFIAKYVQGDQKTYSKEHIRDTLVWGVFGTIVILLMTYNDYR